MGLKLRLELCHLLSKELEAVNLLWSIIVAPAQPTRSVPAFASATCSLAVDCDDPVAPGCDKSLGFLPLKTSIAFGQPLHTPQAFVALAMRGDAGPSFDVPYLDLAVETSAQQVLAGMAPVETRNPGGMPTEVCDLLTRVGIVQGDDTSIACCCKERGAG